MSTGSTLSKNDPAYYMCEISSMLQEAKKHGITVSCERTGDIGTILFSREDGKCAGIVIGEIRNSQKRN